MKSIKNLILNVQIKINSEKSETVKLVQEMNDDKIYVSKNQPIFDFPQSSKIPYKKI